MIGFSPHQKTRCRDNNNSSNNRSPSGGSGTYSRKPTDSAFWLQLPAGINPPGLVEKFIRRSRPQFNLVHVSAARIILLIVGVVSFDRLLLVRRAGLLLTGRFRFANRSYSGLRRSVWLMSLIGARHSRREHATQD